LNQVFKASDLLDPPGPTALRPRTSAKRKTTKNSTLPGAPSTKAVGSSVRAISPDQNSQEFSERGFFKECSIERRHPSPRLVAAALWHFVFIVLPFPQLPRGASFHSVR